MLYILSDSQDVWRRERLPEAPQEQELCNAQREPSTESFADNSETGSSFVSRVGKRDKVGQVNQEASPKQALPIPDGYNAQILTKEMDNFLAETKKINEVAPNILLNRIILPKGFFSRKFKKEMLVKYFLSTDQYAALKALSMKGTKLASDLGASA